jgi:pimeloyl-ACP methyl ester carboxylesterase
MLRYAKNPMDHRIVSLNTQIPIWFVYGGSSWMERTAGEYVKEHRDNVIVKVIDNAGHHVYADQYVMFDDYVNNEILTNL